MANRETLKQRAREMRKNPTPAERAFWQALRRTKLHGLRFRRQAVVGPYIVDFFCPMARVVVEFDGDSHLGREEYDLERRQWLEKQGNVVLRFGSDIVHWSDEEILGEIYLACRGRFRTRRPPLPSPLPRRGEGTGSPVGATQPTRTRLERQGDPRRDLPRMLSDPEAPSP